MKGWKTSDFMYNVQISRYRYISRGRSLCTLYVFRAHTLFQHLRLKVTNVNLRHIDWDSISKGEDERMRGNVRGWKGEKMIGARGWEVERMREVDRIIKRVKGREGERARGWKDELARGWEDMWEGERIRGVERMRGWEDKWKGDMMRGWEWLRG